MLNRFLAWVAVLLPPRHAPFRADEARPVSRCKCGQLMRWNYVQCSGEYWRPCPGCKRQHRVSQFKMDGDWVIKFRTQCLNP